MTIRKGILSVTDKTGILEFAEGLMKQCQELTLIASGGTAKELQKGGVAYTSLETYTGFPECFGGRVKTLHPKIAGGILQREEDLDEALSYGIDPIDLVVCNLYRFADAVKERTLPIESMDIGGPTLIRSAAKNFCRVAVVVDPTDYPALLQEIKEEKGSLSLKTRERLAVKAVQLTAEYEAVIAEAFAEKLIGDKTRYFQFTKGRELRYGENPDQQGWVYEWKGSSGLAQGKVLTGKEPSYNNFEDGTAAWRAVQELRSLSVKEAFAIVKHGGLCGLATADTAADAFKEAWNCDSKSAFGGVVASLQKVEATLIPELTGKFIEVLAAPEFSDEFIKWVKENKPNLRCIQVEKGADTHFMKSISGGVLLQTAKPSLSSEHLSKLLNPVNGDHKIGVVTEKQPDKEKLGLIGFGIAAVKYGKSNACALVQEKKSGHFTLLGMGAGQPNRVDSLERLAFPKARENLNGSEIENAVLVSDGFFPFADSIEAAGEQGIKLCVQPGGSKRDQEVIEAANKKGICMIFTGERYFYH